jgi:aliphatic nitrilase
VQAAPVFLDRDATIEKACDLIDEAGNAGARLVVFPETWVPMYPFWHTNENVYSADVFTRLWKNSVELPSPSTAKIAEAARRANAYVVLGINERDLATRGTLYNTMVWFSPRGEIMHRHRKLMPTFTERTVWGFGDGSDLLVQETPLGRLGGLICWEHQMTLVKYALYAQGEQVHCAQWPAFSSQNEHIAFGTRQYAFEGACFVVSACGMVPKGKLPKEIAGLTRSANGGSSITGPNGDVLAGPIYDKEEILYAEIDVERAIAEKHSRDVAGHYARPDVLQLVVNLKPKPVATFVTGDTVAEPLAVSSAEDVIDRLETVRSYLGSLIDHIESEGDPEVNAAIAEALASIDLASRSS